MHDTFFHRAIELAQRAKNPSPNPRVGAVVVKNGKIIAEGFHARAGEPHAERVALAKAGPAARDAEMYVTLEPCRHTGRTPPCTHAIVAAGIRAVHIGMPDPSSRAGGGAKVLEKFGIGSHFAPEKIAKQCRAINQVWLKNLTADIPYLTLKLALDGAGSTIPQTGTKWITGPAARKEVHRQRAQHDAILVGVNTVIQDDPRMTVRNITVDRQPTRIILDPSGRMPQAAQLLHEPGETVVVTKEPVDMKNAENLVVRQFSLKTILRKLKKQGITSIYVEGGATTAQHLLEANLVDQIKIFTSNELRRWPHWLRRSTWREKSVETFGTDTLYHGQFYTY